MAASSSNASRPFLVEFNPESGMFFPLVTYENLGLLPADQITGFFWNGTTWSCSVKKTEAGKVSFSYFFWEPPVALTELSPALSYETFIFSPCTEAQYRKINLPLLFDAAPAGLADLLSPIPEEFSFYVSWRDNSGTSPVNYFQQGSGGITLNAKAARIPVEQYTAAVFSDGTVYIKKIQLHSKPRSGSQNCPPVFATVNLRLQTACFMLPGKKPVSLKQAVQAL